MPRIITRVRTRVVWSSGRGRLVDRRPQHRQSEATNQGQRLAERGNAGATRRRAIRFHWQALVCRCCVIWCRVVWRGWLLVGVDHWLVSHDSLSQLTSSLTPPVPCLLLQTSLLLREGETRQRVTTARLLYCVGASQWRTALSLLQKTTTCCDAEHLMNWFLIC